MIEAALLGTSGMMPLPNRYLASFALRLNGKLLLIDCGEGTQVTHKLLGWGFRNIEVICFTHFHADHISGLAGLLLTIGNSEREEPVTLIGPAGLEFIVRSLLVIAPELPFDIEFIELAQGGDRFKHMSVSGFDISACLVNHGITCYAYSVQLDRQGKFDADRAKAQNIPVKLWSHLQKGEEVLYDGKVLTPDTVLGPARKGLKISYCTDTRPASYLADFVRDSDLFVCEGLYGEDDKLEKAASHRHMIFSEAARIAKDANAGELWLTHFSPAMTNPREFLPYARNIFPNSYTGYDRKNKTFRFSEE